MVIAKYLWLDVAACWHGNYLQLSLRLLTLTSARSIIYGGQMDMLLELGGGAIKMSPNYCAVQKCIL